MAAYSDRETAVYFAKLAIETQRYGDAVEAMKSVALLDVALTSEERNLLAEAYKNVIASGRATMNTLSSIEQRERGNRLNVERIKVYIQKVDTEMADICNGAKSILAEHSIPSATSYEDRVFYLKMIGDHLRYRAESKTADHERRKLGFEALALYKTATKIAEKVLHVANPIRLNVALNPSVVYYEFCCSPKTACEIAQKAHDGAMGELDTLNGEAREKSDRILHILKDKITLWAASGVTMKHPSLFQNFRGNDFYAPSPAVPPLSVLPSTTVVRLTAEDLSLPPPPTPEAVQNAANNAGAAEGAEANAANNDGAAE